MEASAITLTSRGTWRTDARDEQLRRGLNVIVAALALVLALPLMVLIAVAVKLSSPGPVIFSQDRVGVDRRTGRDGGGGWRRRSDAGGRVFRIYKFRTMTTQPPSSSQVWAKRDDPRITSVGRILRKYRLDELPQLVNVLKGDMNVVGPRPEQPAIFHELREQLADYPVRQTVLPGITGLAQVRNGYDQSLEDVVRKLRYDIQYIRNRSAAEDLRIMARTIPVMIFKFGSL